MYNAIEICKAFGDDTRMQIMQLLNASEQLCVCELTAALDLSQPKISRHLTILKNAGLVDCERKGQWMFYKVSTAAPAWVDTMLHEQNSAFGPALMRANARLDAMVSRPERCC